MYIKPREYIVRVQHTNSIDDKTFTLTIGTFYNEHDWYELIIDLLQSGYKYAYRVTDAEYSIYVLY